MANLSSLGRKLIGMLKNGRFAIMGLFSKNKLIYQAIYSLQGSTPSFKFSERGLFSNGIFWRRISNLKEHLKALFNNVHYMEI